MSFPRRTLRPLAWFALYAFLCGWMLPFLEAHPLGMQDDAACVVVATGGDSAPSQIDAVRNGDGEPTHCVVCHLMRAMSGAVSSDVTTLATPFVASAPDRLPDHLTLASALSAPTSRGPPPSSL